MKRLVAMDIRSEAGADKIRINVEFDMSGLTPDQIADWAVSSNGIRVWYQNRERVLGYDHLVKLSKTTQYVKVLPCGTRQVSISEEQFLRQFAKSEERYNALVEKYGSAGQALDAIKAMAAEMGLK